MSNSVNYYEKYLKYESKFLMLKAVLEGGTKKLCSTYKDMASCNNIEGCIWHPRKGKKPCLNKLIPKNKPN